MGSRRFSKLVTSATATLLFVVGAGCQEDESGALRSIIPDNLVPGAIDPCMKAEDESRLIGEMLDLVNQERSRRNLSILRRNDTLDRIAEFYACRLIDGGFFAHEDPHDSSRIDTRAGDFGYAFQKIGENLGARQYSVEQVMREWMKSPGHRENILDPDFIEIGLAVRLGGTHGVYWVQEFGRPLTARPLSEMNAGSTDADTGTATMEAMKEIPSAPATSQPSAQTSPRDVESWMSDTAHPHDLYADEWDVVLALIDAD